MTNRGFMNILWGLLITAFDFRVVGINLLPDFAGFILISMGLIQCVEYSRSFERAKYLSFVLIIVMIPDIVELFIVDYCLFPYVLVNALWPIYAIGGVLNLVMMGFLLTGIRELAMDVKMSELARDVKFLLGAYLIHGGSLLSLFLFSHVSCPGLISPYLSGFLIVIPTILVGIGIPIFIGLLYVVYEGHKIVLELSSQADIMI